MQRKLVITLWDIKNVGEEILGYTQTKDLQDYLQDQGLRPSVERCFTIIGGAKVRIRKEFPEDHARIVAASKVIHFRNFLVHRYNVVDDEEVWRIVEVSLPPLLAEISSMLGEKQG